LAYSENEDPFDFTNEVLGADAVQKSPFIKDSQEGEVRTSFLLVNTLLTLLVSKEIIKMEEVNSLMAELHIEYKKTRRGGDAL